MLWNFNIVSKKILTYSVFDKKLAFFDYFEQSWKMFFIFAFNFIHVVAIVLILSIDSSEHNGTFSKYLSLFKRATLIGKMSTWGEPLDQSASSS